MNSPNNLVTSLSASDSDGKYFYLFILLHYIWLDGAANISRELKPIRCSRLGKRPYLNFQSYVQGPVVASLSKHIFRSEALSEAISE